MPRDGAPNISFIVSSLDEGDELRETVESVLSGHVVPGEIIVVDDGSVDGSCDFLESGDWRRRGVHLHRTQRLGVAGARNFGASLAVGTHLVFLDAHCRLEPMCLSALREALFAQPAAIVAPSICDFGSSVYGCGARLIDPELRIRWLAPRELSDCRTLPVAPGGCLAMGKSIFESLRGFGAFRELGLEDVDFSLRAWRAGVDIIAAPLAKLTHKFRPTPPYRPGAASRVYNVAKVALTHFDGVRRERCLRTLIGVQGGAEALVDAFCSDWESRRRGINEFSMREIETFFEEFGDWG
jgi:GT2 family glycosyltransferase